MLLAQKQPPSRHPPTLHFGGSFLSMIFCPLYSGSSGNALFVQAGNTRLLIDAGKSGKCIREALNSIGVDPATLNAILVTHEHSDHIAGVGVLCRKYHIPVLANAATWAAMEKKVGEIPAGTRMTFDSQSDFYLGDIGVAPFLIPHDAAEPVGFRLYHGNTSIATATDLGHFTRIVKEHVSGSSLVLLESNHDPDMLRRNSHYTETLKQRILGNHGHLSNDACAEAVVQLAESGVKQIILGHLSGENNLPALALETSTRRAEREGIVLGEDLNLDIALRDTVGPVYTLQEGA